MIIIRSSSLTSYADCPRRTASRIFKREIEAAGYKLRETAVSIGAIIGTAMHNSAAFALENKQKTGVLPSVRDFNEKCVDSINTEFNSSEIILDQITKSKNDAEKQTLRVSNSLKNNVLDFVTPVFIENRLEAKFNDRIKLTGQVDVNVETGVVDWKSGRFSRQNGAQYGAYLMLANAHKMGDFEATEFFVKRVAQNTEQPAPQKIQYDGDICKKQASAVLKKIDRDLQDFIETGDKFSFLANPQSMLCSDKFCPAWGTNFCTEHK